MVGVTGGAGPAGATGCGVHAPRLVLFTSSRHEVTKRQPGVRDALTAVPELCLSLDTPETPLI